MADATQTQRNGNLARHHADDRNGNRVRRDPAAPIDEEIVVLPLAHVDTAAAAADHHAGFGSAMRKPASTHASRAAITPTSAARE